MSTPETLKSFSDLHQDYAFFEQHATETEQSLAAWLPLVRDRWTQLHALDFGAGSGSFTSQFLQRAGFPEQGLRLTLVEPDPGFREKAGRALAPFTAHPIQAWPLLERELEPTFDLIFSHHVLYYVPDLQTTLSRLVGALRPAGRMLLIQGGQGNGLNQLVFAAFKLLGETSPYHYSEDTLAALERLGTHPQVHKVHNVVDFPDSEEGRWRLLRFLLSEHLAKLEPAVALQLFEPFRRGDRIHIPNADELFVIDI
jgi:SAM-dependent methyltransferase